MPTFVRSTVIAAPQRALFELMQDYDRRLTWDPFLSEARLLDATEAGLGVKAWCVDHHGRGMETEYVSFDPPSRVAVRMTKGPWIFSKFAGAWIYEALSPNETRVVFRYHVESRLGRVSHWALSWIFAREMDARLSALKQTCDDPSCQRVAGKTAVEVVALCLEPRGEVLMKAAYAELSALSPSDEAAQMLVTAFEEGRAPAHLVAHLLGACRTRVGYPACRAILLGSHARLSESYAADAMTRIAGSDALNDLSEALWHGAHLRNREAAASALKVIAPAGLASELQRALIAERVRSETVGAWLCDLGVADAELLQWIASGEHPVRTAAVHAVLTVVRGRGRPSREVLEALLADDDAQSVLPAGTRAELEAARAKRA